MNMQPYCQPSFLSEKNFENFMDKPLLRQDLQVIPIMEANQRGLVLQDSLIATRGLFIGAEDVVVLALFNGQHTLQEIQAEVSRQTGRLIYAAEIEKLVRMLDETYFLDNQNYHNHLHDLFTIYKAQPDRASLMAGTSFSADPVELNAYLDDIFKRYQPRETPDLPAQTRGIIAPHIDIERGQETYARIFTALRNYPPADTYLVLGVNHRFSTGNPFIATDRNYVTPLGRLEVDYALLSAISSELDWDLLEGEMAHINEHSVEFPALFLSYIYPLAKPRIVPILANFSDKRDARIEQFVSAVKNAISATDQRVVVIASVDFSHIGPQFGWDRLVTVEDAQRTERQDLYTIRLLERSDADGFYDDIMADRNARNIDALGAGYVFLKILEGTPGKLVHYNQAFNPNFTVTFTGLIY